MNQSTDDPTVATSCMDVEALLIKVADALKATLDLNTFLQRVAEVVKRVIDYEIFSIPLLNERTQELRLRFQIAHLPEIADPPSLQSSLSAG